MSLEFLHFVHNGVTLTSDASMPLISISWITHTHTHTHTQIFLCMRIYFGISTWNSFRCVRWRRVQVFSCFVAEWNIDRHESYTDVRIYAINCTSVTPFSTSWQSTHALDTTQFMTHIKTAAIIREFRAVQQVQQASSGRDLFGSRKMFLFVLHTEYKQLWTCVWNSYCLILKSPRYNFMFISFVYFRILIIPIKATQYLY